MFIYLAVAVEADDTTPLPDDEVVTEALETELDGFGFDAGDTYAVLTVQGIGFSAAGLAESLAARDRMSQP
jgi:hypothetical protein